jgi:hypothetical protein
MRMRFTTGDETAYQQRRHELREQFARWLLGRPMAVDPFDADVLMDWKFEYGDGALDRWMIKDVQEFLFEWCPRKLSAPPQDAELVPLAVAAFVEFLDDAGLLARTSSRPAEVRRHCEASTAEFLQEMANPTNFGLAKSLFSGGPPPDAKELDRLVGLLRESSPGELREVLERIGLADEVPVGPVSPPDPAEQLTAIRASTAMRQLRSLAEHCAAGRELTAPGDLPLDDARFLADAIATEDGLEAVVSVADLPGLDRLVHLGLSAGVVERKSGRLVTVPEFALLDEVAAYQRVVKAAVEVGLSQLSGFGAVFDECDLVDGSVDLILAELLDAGPDGVAPLELIRLIEPATTAGFEDGYEQPEIFECVDIQLENLEYLGVVTMPEAKRKVTLTPAGIPVAVALVEETGAIVDVRSASAPASAREIVELVGHIDSDEWHARASAWFAARADPATAAAELVTEITAENRERLAVARGLAAVGAVAGEHAVAAVRCRQGGPHDGLVLHWLLDRGVIDPRTVEPMRLATSWVDVLATHLDIGGREELLNGMDERHHIVIDMLERIWRLDHPRLAEVLETIGAHHPVKPVAKAARKALMKHRNRYSAGSTPKQDTR